MVNSSMISLASTVRIEQPQHTLTRRQKFEYQLQAGGHAHKLSVLKQAQGEDLIVKDLFPESVKIKKNY